MILDLKYNEMRSATSFPTSSLSGQWKTLLQSDCKSTSRSQMYFQLILFVQTNGLAFEILANTMRIHTIFKQIPHIILISKEGTIYLKVSCGSIRNAAEIYQ